jgi:DNA-binding MarR family transcriptional regulator
VANRQLFLKAATTSEYVSQIVERQLEPVGIPAYLLAVLTHVRDHAPVTPSRISELSGIPMTTLRDNIQRLVDRRLIRRTRNPHDGRSYLLAPTARGLAVTEAGGEALLDAYVALERLLPRPLLEFEHTLDELNAVLREVLALGADTDARASRRVGVARR